MYAKFDWGFSAAVVRGRIRCLNPIVRAGSVGIMLGVRNVTLSGGVRECGGWWLICVPSRLKNCPKSQFAENITC